MSIFPTHYGRNSTCPNCRYRHPPRLTCVAAEAIAIKHNIQLTKDTPQMSSIDKDDGMTDIERATKETVRLCTAGMRPQVVALLAAFDAKKVTDLRHKDLDAYTRKLEALWPPAPLSRIDFRTIGSAIDDAKSARYRATGFGFGEMFIEDGSALCSALADVGLCIVPIATSANGVPEPKFAIGDRVLHDTHSRHPLPRGEYFVAGYEVRYRLERVDGGPAGSGLAFSGEKLKSAIPAPAPAPAPPPQAAPVEAPKFKVGERVETAAAFGPRSGVVTGVEASYSYTLHGISPTRWHQDNLKPFSYI